MEDVQAPQNTTHNTQIESVPNGATPSSKPGVKAWPWIILLLILIVAVSGIVYVPSIFRSSPTPTPTPNAYLQTNHKLVIGTDATYPPMESTDADGNLEGYDIDLGSKIAEVLGVEVEFKNIGWDDLFPALMNSEVDMIISGVTINDEREALYDFSSPYLNAGQVIITQRTNTSIASTDDLSGKMIAVQGGTTNEIEALKYTTNDKVISFDNFADATEALVAGNADAIFSDLTNAKDIVNANPTLKIASAPFTSDYYGIVVRKGETALVNELNDVLETLRQQGYLVFLQQKWLE